MATMNVSLPEQMKDWVEAQSKDGERQQAIAELQAEITKGLESGPGQPFDLEEFLTEMRNTHEV